MTSRTNPEVHVRRRHLQLGEEDVGHIGVVVLAGVHQSLFDPAQVSESAQHGRGFHKVRARADHVKDVHDQSLTDRMTCLSDHVVGNMPSRRLWLAEVQPDGMCASSCNWYRVKSLPSHFRSKTVTGINAIKPSR